ncbi:MAG: MmcQ/YjbR family DNA-binding protein [Solirubrobacteraceae bacterium]
MNIEELRDFCLSLKEIEEKMPFDNETLTFSVKGKIFCLTNINKFKFINLKCDPEIAIELRETYTEVTPGYHMNKKLWNSVNTQGNIPNNLIQEWIVNSYNLVIAGLSKKIQNDLKNGL